MSSVGQTATSEQSLLNTSAGNYRENPLGDTVLLHATIDDRCRIADAELQMRRLPQLRPSPEQSQSLVRRPINGCQTGVVWHGLDLLRLSGTLMLSVIPRRPHLPHRARNQGEMGRQHRTMADG